MVALHRGGLEDASYELAAAAVMLSVRDPGAEPLPNHVAQKVWAAVYPAPVAPPVPQQHFAPGAPAPWPVAGSGAPTVIAPLQPRAGTLPMPPQQLPGTQVSANEGAGIMPGAPQGNVAMFPYRSEVAPISGEGPPRRQRREAMRWAGWLAAAACLALAIGGWWPRPPTEIARGASPRCLASSCRRRSPHRSIAARRCSVKEER